MPVRTCDECGSKIPAYQPRKRRGDGLVCAACASGRPGGGMVSASAEPHEGPVYIRDSRGTLVGPYYSLRRARADALEMPRSVIVPAEGTPAPQGGSAHARRHEAEIHAPYRIEEDGDGYKVVNDLGETKGTHDTYDEARQHQKALYANVEGAPEMAERKKKQREGAKRPSSLTPEGGGTYRHPRGRVEQNRNSTAFQKWMVFCDTCSEGISRESMQPWERHTSNPPSFMNLREAADYLDRHHEGEVEVVIPGMMAEDGVAVVEARCHTCGETAQFSGFSAMSTAKGWLGMRGEEPHPSALERKRTGGREQREGAVRHKRKVISPPDPAEERRFIERLPKYVQRNLDAYLERAEGRDEHGNPATILTVSWESEDRPGGGSPPSNRHWKADPTWDEMLPPQYRDRHEIVPFDEVQVGDLVIGRNDHVNMERAQRVVEKDERRLVLEDGSEIKATTTPYSPYPFGGGGRPRSTMIRRMTKKAAGSGMQRTAAQLRYAEVTSWNQEFPQQRAILAYAEDQENDIIMPLGAIIWNDERKYLVTVSVLEHVRGRGIARELFEHMDAVVGYPLPDDGYRTPAGDRLLKALGRPEVPLVKTISDEEANRPIQGLFWTFFNAPADDPDLRKLGKGASLMAAVRGKIKRHRKTAHDAGEGEALAHCPFCGGGNIWGRSDGTVVCGYCDRHFTVQIQPAHPAMPQSLDGESLDVPGMPGEVGGEPEGTVEEDPPEEPEAEDEPDEGDEDDEDGEQKEGKYLLTEAGYALDEDAFIRHLALRHADDPETVAKDMREGARERR